MMKKIRIWAVGLYHKMILVIEMRLIKWLYNYTKKQKDSGDESATKSYLCFRKLLFVFYMMPVTNILNGIDKGKSRYINAEATQYLNESAINRVTSGDVYKFLKRCNPQEARDIITRFFPKQKDFDILVKHIESNNKEGFEAEIVKRDNRDFYKYCAGAGMINDISSNARNKRLTSFSRYSTKFANKTIREIEKVDRIVGSDFSEMIRAATDFNDSSFEPMLKIYKLYIDVIIKSEDDTWIDNKQQIYKIFNNPFVKEIFDGQKYIEDKIAKLENKQKTERKQLLEKITPTVLLEKLIVIEVKGKRDEEKSKIVVNNIKKYYEHLIDEKKSIKGVPTGKLFLALRELHYLNQTDVSIFIESITEFGKRTIDGNFNIGADNGVYKFINNINHKQLEAIKELKNELIEEEESINES